MRAILLAGAALLCGIALANAAAMPQIAVAPVAKTDTTVTGEKITVPQNPVVSVSIATFAPGAALPVHTHPYPHYVYVLDGVLTVTNLDTKKTFTVKKGDFLVETNTARHFGKNDGAVPVRLLVIDQLPEGATSNMQVRTAK